MGVSSDIMLALKSPQLTRKNNFFAFDSANNNSESLQLGSVKVLGTCQTSFPHKYIHLFTSLVCTTRWCLFWNTLDWNRLLVSCSPLGIELRITRRANVCVCGWPKGSNLSTTVPTPTNHLYLSHSPCPAKTASLWAILFLGRRAAR